MPAAEDAGGKGRRWPRSCSSGRSMLRTGRLMGWGTSLYGLTEEEIGIVEEGIL